MKRSLVAGLVLLGVLVVGAVWFFHGSGDSKSGAKVTGAVAVAPKRLESDHRARRPAPQPAAVLMDDDPEGTLRLEGQVIDADQAPVGGAVVSVDSNPPRTATTEQDGSFYFDKLVSRTYTLVARAGGGAAGPVTARLTATSDPVILRLRPAARVEVTVVEAGRDRPIPSATVELRGLDLQSRTTGGEGKAMFEGVVPGGHRVVAYAPGFAKQHSFVRVAEPGATAHVHLGLRAGARVAGRVLQRDGTPVEGARVSYSGASEWSLQADPRLDAVETDADGRFSFAALPAGSFRFIARARGFAPGRSEIVTLDGRTEQTDVEIEVDPGARIVGQVVSADGAPVGSARVRVAQSRRRWGGTRQSFADDSGHFEIDSLPRKPVQIMALHESGTSERTEVDLSQAPAERELTLTLEVTGTIAGVVVDPQGEPVEGAQVVALLDFDKNPGARRSMWSMFRLRGLPRELTDAGGRFAIHGLEKGSYQIRALPPGVSTGRRQMFLREGKPAETGDTDVRVVLVPDGGIKGKVAFANGEPPELFTASVGRRGGTPFSTEDGSFELRDLPPRDDYTLRISGPSFDDKRVTDLSVTQGEMRDVGTITVTRGRKITGKVVTAGGSAVEGALVRSGKMVFGDGSSSKAPFGPPQARNTKETRTDENGEFAIYGVPMGDLAIVAEHEKEGRSQAITVRGRGESIHGLTLVLEPYGALEGTVTRDGAPAEQVIVNASSTTSPSVSYGVATGADGTFRFDRLAPDEYKVSAMTGRGPRRGFGFHSSRVDVASGETAHVDLKIESGNVTLTLDLADKNGGELGFVSVSLVGGEMAAKTARELQAKVGADADVYSHWSFSVRGAPVTVEKLKPGRYTACAVPYPPEVEGMDATMEYMEREGDELAVFCQPVQVAPEPAEQSATLEVSTPKYVPPPA